MWVKHWNFNLYLYITEFIGYCYINVNFNQQGTLRIAHGIVGLYSNYLIRFFWYGDSYDHCLPYLETTLFWTKNEHFITFLPQGSEFTLT